MGRPLPGFSELPKTKDQLATAYINSLYEQRAYKLHQKFFNNYLDGRGYSVIMSHIRKAYMNYVLSGTWTQEKFDTILYVLISNENTLSNFAFENMGTEYDDGSIKYEKFHADTRNNTIDNDLSTEVSDEELFRMLNSH